MWCRVHTCTPLQVPFEPIWTSDVTQRFGSQQVSTFNCHINCPDKPCWDMVTDSCNRCFSSWTMDANPNRKNNWTNLQRTFLPRGTGLTLNTWKHALKDQVKTMNYRHKVATWNLWNIQLYRVNQCDIDHIKTLLSSHQNKKKTPKNDENGLKTTQISPISTAFSAQLFQHRGSSVVFAALSADAFAAAAARLASLVLLSCSASWTFASLVFNFPRRYDVTKENSHRIRRIPFV